MYVIDLCFFKQKTSYVMRISVWSSDVCSSDLIVGRVVSLRRDAIAQDCLGPADAIEKADRLAIAVECGQEQLFMIAEQEARFGALCPQVDQPVDHLRDRKSVVSGKGVSVRVDLGGIRLIKTKTEESQRQ